MSRVEEETTRVHKGMSKKLRGFTDGVGNTLFCTDIPFVVWEQREAWARGAVGIESARIYPAVIS